MVLPILTLVAVTPGVLAARAPGSFRVAAAAVARPAVSAALRPIMVCSPEWWTFTLPAGEAGGAGCARRGGSSSATRQRGLEAGHAAGIGCNRRLRARR